MTSPEATLASAAGEVTLDLAFAAPSLLPPRSPRPASRSPWSRPAPAIGPAPDLLCVGRRHARESRSCPRTARASDDQGPHVDRRAGAFALGGRIRRQRGLGVAEDSPWISSRTAPGLTVEPFFAHFRVHGWSDQCTDHGVSNARQTSLGAPPRQHRALSWGLHVWCRGTIRRDSSGGSGCGLTTAGRRAAGAKAPRRSGARRRAPRERAGLTCRSVSSTRVRAARR